MKRKFKYKQWWSTIPPISATPTSHWKKPRSTTYAKVCSISLHTVCTYLKSGPVTPTSYVVDLGFFQWLVGVADIGGIDLQSIPHKPKDRLIRARL
jgi:hypothetical protein